MTHTTMMNITEVIRQALTVYQQSGLTTNDLLKQRYALKEFAESAAAGDQDPSKLAEKAVKTLEFLDGFEEQDDGDQLCLRDALVDLIGLTRQYLRYTNEELGNAEFIDAERALAAFDEERRKKQS